MMNLVPTVIKRASVALGTMIALLSVSAVAQAQFSSQSGADTIIDADRAVTANGVTTLVGQVDIRQGDARMLADKVVITNAQNNGSGGLNSSSIDRVVATGNFYYVTPEQEVRGDRGVYTRANDGFVVTGDVILLQDGNVVTGTKLDYNLTTRDARVSSECQGRRCAPDDRVKILIKNTDGALSGRPDGAS